MYGALAREDCKMQNAKLKIYNLQFQRGVTLIEMSVVLSIVLLLIIVGIVEYFSFGRKAIRADTLVAAKALATAMKMYKYNDPDSLYPAVVTPFLNTFTNVGVLEVTGLLRKYNFISIYRVPAGSVCVVGRVKDITPIYWINYCAEAGTDNRALGTNQPSCCWTKDGLDCSVDANWYACERRF